MYKALSLISGGLDSMLATKLIIDQGEGVRVEGINFFTGFTGDHEDCFKSLEQNGYNAKWVSDQLGIKLHVINVADSFKSVLLNPKYGYGANLNPCLDCKLFMVAQAKKFLQEQGYDFLISGEVLGQRPKSQRKDTLPLASKVSGDLIVRPLSAKLLQPTRPEIAGWIKRELLCDFSGRSRKPQIALAAKLGFREFPQPAGGCVLTEPNFCHRLKDLWQGRCNQDYSLDEILLLRFGRHLRIRQDLKIIVGRNAAENRFITKFSGKYILMQTISYPGALLLFDGNLHQSEFIFMAKLAAYFSQARGANNAEVSIKKPLLAEEVMSVVALKKEEILEQWYV